MAAFSGAETELEPAGPKYDPTILIQGLQTLSLGAVLETLSITVTTYLGSQQEWHKLMQHGLHIFLSYLCSSMQSAARELWQQADEECTPVAMHHGFITLDNASRICCAVLMRQLWHSCAACFGLRHA